MAVVGAGWAGCAAAVELARAGHSVTLFEAARTLGGRARRVEAGGKPLDNGQHILLGAYAETLRLLKLVGIAREQVLLELPLQMRYPKDAGGMDFVAPRWPAPLHLAAALLRASGLAGADKLSLARFSTTARWMDWSLHRDCSVSELLERFDQTPRLIQLMWRPLCLAALNTPPERASAQVFLNVLRDSLGAKRAASDMLLPRVDLSALFPDSAANFIQDHGGTVQQGVKVTALRQDGQGGWLVEAQGAALGGIWNGQADAVVLATPASQAASLLRPLSGAAIPSIIAQLEGLAPAAITTCYLQYDAGLRLEQPFFALVDDAAAGAWGQFVFDRGQLDAAQAGLLAVVVSASGQAAQLGQAPLAEAIAAQLAAVLRRPELSRPAWSQVISEKRATFACTPGLVRPPNASGLPGLMLAGDYTAGDYPATIESAVRSGVLAAAAIA
ncbi:MAG TPA: hydroxysqualene dehydroxylase HpnE [Janthinobacterium sp.]|nr:hydroxysqualene dehydroxylase HpnE [Janthinobacterium sp.]